MCRLGFINYRTNEDVTELVKLATTYYGYANGDGMGFAYIDPKGHIEMRKTPQEAIQFWLDPANQGLKIDTKSLIMHTRLASAGEVKLENAHPFFDEKSGINFCHNGTVFGYTKLKEHLITKGYRFEGNTDSEVLAKTYAEYGKDFTKKLKEYGVTGRITCLAVHPDGTIMAYTNTDDLRMWKTPKGIVGFSDAQFFTQGEKIEVKEDKIYTIKDGEIVKIDDAAIIHTYSGQVTGNYGIGYDYDYYSRPRMGGMAGYGQAYMGYEEIGEPDERRPRAIIPGGKERWQEEKQWNPKKREWKIRWRREKWNPKTKKWVLMFTQKHKPGSLSEGGTKLNNEGVSWLGVKGWRDELTAFDIGSSRQHHVKDLTSDEVIDRIKKIGAPEVIETNLEVAVPITELDYAERNRVRKIAEGIGYNLEKEAGKYILERPMAEEGVQGETVERRTEPVKLNAEGVDWIGIVGVSDSTLTASNRAENRERLRSFTLDGLIKRIKEEGAPEEIETNLVVEDEAPAGLPMRETTGKEIERLQKIGMAIGYIPINVEGVWHLKRVKPSEEAEPARMEGEEIPEPDLEGWIRREEWNDKKKVYEMMWVQRRWNPIEYQWDTITAQKNKPTKKQLKRQAKGDREKAMEKLWTTEREAEKRAERESEGLFDDDDADDAELYVTNPAEWAKRHLKKKTY